MPVSYAFRGDVLELRASGTYAPGEVAQAFERALADPDRPVLRALLYDVRESSVVGGRSTPEVRQAVAFFESLGQQVGQRVALLATTDVAYGVMRMVAAWAEARDIDASVFRDADEAFAWASR
jgi:hypothetical protein